MRKILFKIYLLFFFVGIAQPILSQSPYYYYKQLGIKEGLSQSKVQCVLNDHRGYLWIGTESGLIVMTVTIWSNICIGREMKERSLPTISLLSPRLFMQSMGSYDEWICLYDRGSDSFRTLSNNGKPIYVASYLLVEGGILLGGSGAIYKYVYATKSWNLCIMRKTLFIQSLLADDTLWWREYPAQFTLARHIFLQYEDVWSEENRVVYRK